MTVRIVACALLAFPAGWLVGVVVDRVPDRLPLFSPLAPVRLEGREPALHLAVIVLFVAAGWRLGDIPAAALAGYLLLFGVLVAVSVIDLERMRIPDLVVLPALVASAALVVVVSLVNEAPHKVVAATVGAVAYFGFLLVVHLIYPRGMGFGDVKLAALMGLYIGWLAHGGVESVGLVLWAMLIAFVLGSVFGVGLLIVRRRSEPMPFGPFLALGTTAVVLIGPGAFG